MKKILIILCIIYTSCTQSQNRTERVDVIRTWDGDTFDAQREDGSVIRIRMAYIDAPELSQSFGLAATYVLDSLIQHKTLLLYKLDVDKYGRTVAVVYNSPKGESINTFMVKRGMAHVYPQYAPKEIYNMQLEAKKNKKGLWQNPYPILPYIYRSRKK